MRTAPPRARSVAATVVLVVGLGSSVALIVTLARQVARERERTVRSETGERGAQNQAENLRGQLKEAREDLARATEEGARRARAADTEVGSLRRQLADTQAARDSLRERYRAAVAERDRAVEDLLAAKRDQELLRADLAKSAARATAAEEAGAGVRRELEETRKRAEEAASRAAALVRPLLQDLRSPDGSIRVRAHEALCAWSGRQLEYRTNGTPEERDADAKAIEALLLGRQEGR